jgi:hypothetical protein
MSSLSYAHHTLLGMPLSISFFFGFVLVCATRAKAKRNKKNMENKTKE